MAFPSQNLSLPSQNLSFPLKAPEGSSATSSFATGPSLNQALLTHLSTLEAKLAYYEKSDFKLPPTALHDTLRDAHLNPVRAAQRILHLVRPVAARHDTLLAIARLCLTGPVGRVGQRRGLRAVAVLLLDAVLKEDAEHVAAMCLKGEILTPGGQGGHGDPFTPRSVLQEAFCLFEQASKSNDPQALFLVGRWLMVNEPLHRKPARVEEGRNLILRALDLGCARAMNYVAETLESADFESKNMAEELGAFFHRLPTNARGATKASVTAREQFIVKLYVDAAQRGDAAALNDLGACVAGGYGGLECNFDLVVLFYQASIKLGENIAYDNLGTHYESGMDNKCPDKIDRVQALRYYREGTRRRSAKCALYMGACYEEGVPGKGGCERNLGRAQDYYMHAIRLADDAHDTNTAARAIRDLSSLMFTRIKLSPDPKCEETTKLTCDLRTLLCNEALFSRSMDQLNGAILNAIRSKTNRYTQLTAIVGENHAHSIVSHVKRIERSLRIDPKPDTLALYEHIVGVPFFGFSVSSARPQRTTTARAAASSRSAVRKRRKVSV